MMFVESPAVNDSPPLGYFTCRFVILTLPGIILNSGKDYITVIKNLDNSDKAKGTVWLQKIVDSIIQKSEQFL